MRILASWWHLRGLCLAVGAAALAASCAIFSVAPARALPSFARQTGLECAVCHVAFPELTPTGRLFKLGGYVRKGGEYLSNLPPLAAVVQGQFTHTEKDQAASPAPHFATNDNFGLEAASAFYAGAIYSPIGLGAFAQLTYDGAAHNFGWDNTDVRLAHTGELDDNPIIFGLSLNNNPTVQDVWNTTPAWRFPFVLSNVAPQPGAATLIEGGFGQNTVGLTAYTYWNNLVYGEVGFYRSLGFQTLRKLGANVAVDVIDGVAPYWRFAVEPSWGKHSLEVGTFGITAATFPARVTANGTDRRTDFGFDTQYQFIGDRDQISVQASLIHEAQRFNATQAQGGAVNLDNHLDSFHVKTSYFYDHTYGINLSYFDVSGSPDAGLFAGNAANSPNSSGFLIEANYVPFMHNNPYLPWWPWANIRFAIQYTIFTKFDGGRANIDGAGRNASDNNTLFLLAWLAF
jgi:hypothetical protein